MEYKVNKLLIFILFVSISFFNTNEVNANACDGIAGCRVTKNSVIKVAGAGELYAGAGNNFYRDVSEASSQSKNPRQAQKYADLGLNAIGTYSQEYMFSDAYSALFCVDPQHQGYNPVVARRFLLDTNSSKKVQAFDIAAMSILTDSATNHIRSNGSSLNLNGGVNSDYFSRLLALRILMLAFKYNDGTGNNEQFQRDYYAGYTVAHRWLQGNDVLEPYLDLSEALAKYAGGDSFRLAWENGYNKHPGYDFQDKPGYNVVANAKNYFVNALVEATEFLENQSGEVKISDTVMAGLVTSINSTKGEIVQKEVTHTIKVSGLANTGDNNFIIKGLQFKDNKVHKGLNITIKSIKVGSTVYEGINIDKVYGKNLLELGHDLKNETDITFTVQFSGYKSTNDASIEVLDCENPDLDYYIDISYTGANPFGKYSSYVGVIWQSNPVVESNNILQNVQRYLTVYEALDSTAIEAEEQTYKIENSTSLIQKCETNCDILREACVKKNKKNSTECRNYINEKCDSCDDLEVMCDMNIQTYDKKDSCDEFNAICDVKCEVSYSTFECCDNSDKLIISDKDNKKVNIIGPENVRACFVTTVDKKCEDSVQGDDSSCVGVETKDEKENSYALATTKDNKYCTVSCKEDYSFEMPTARLVNAGRYFTFKAKINGTKTCYTNTIDREQYNKDIIQAQEDIVDAYAEYYKWKMASEAPIKSRRDSKSARNSCCLRRVSCPTEKNPNRTCCRSRCRASDSTNTWTEYYVQISYDNYYVAPNDKNFKTGIIEEVSKKSASFGYYADGHKEGSCRSWCCGASCTNGSSGSASTLSKNINKQLANAKKTLENAQSAYQKVINEFNTCGGWNSEINFKPDIYYDYEEDYLEANGLTGEMVQVSKSNVSNSYWYCNSTVNLNGEENAVGKLSGNSYDGCTNLTSTAKNYNTSNVNYMYCTVDGCDGKLEKVSVARYKKMISKTSATYRPATLFYNVYPTGSIVSKGSASGVDATALEYGLPVRLNTKRGIYRYNVNIKNIGEYYNIANRNDNLGRYAGGKNSLLGERIIYACSYLVNIPITSADKLTCKFDECDNCTVNCVGPNCNNTCNGENCVADCIGMGCIYDKDAGSSLVERIVSLNNLFPNGTTSYNWNSSKNAKARETVKTIEDKGNNIYAEEPVLSVTMNPSTAKLITEYNKNANTSGGYANDTLNCYNIGGYKELACYSSFIDDILNDKYGKDIINEKSKIKKSNNYRTGTDVTSSDANKDGYFRLWGGSISADDMLGPSWR